MRGFPLVNQFSRESAFWCLVDFSVMRRAKQYQVLIGISSAFSMASRAAGLLCYDMRHLSDDGRIVGV
jgi:hypothetical protein